MSSVSPHIFARETPLKPPDVSVPGPPWLTAGVAGNSELKLMGQGAAQWLHTHTAAASMSVIIPRVTLLQFMVELPFIPFSTTLLDDIY